MNTADVLQLREELQRVVRALNRANVPYALCGGLALALHGYPRATQDIQLLIRAEDLERLLSVARDLGYNLSAAPMPFNAGQDDEQRIERISRLEGDELITLDLLIVGAGQEETWASRQTVNLDGDQVFLASKTGLIRLKESAGRPQDLADIEKLKSNGPA